MSLFIRVFNSFYTHRKTMRLKAAIGDAAFWVPPRIWAYASEHHPDGNLQDYSAEELAMLIGYSGNATSMLQALLKAGFLNEDMSIHDWAQHNDYHATYAERARHAARARWAKERTKEKEKIREDKIREETSIALSTNKQCFKHDLSMQGQRLHGIPSSAEEVIEAGKHCNPKKDEQTCREFFAYYEGQARTGPNGEIFWITKGEAVVTNWRVKLSAFEGKQNHGNNNQNRVKGVDRNAGTLNNPDEYAHL